MKDLLTMIFLAMGWICSQIAGAWSILQAISLAAKQNIVTWQSALMFVGGYIILRRTGSPLD